jgi:hypothetical protein
MTLAVGCGKTPIHSEQPSDNKVIPNPPSHHQEVQPHPERTTPPSAYLPVTWKIKFAAQCNESETQPKCTGAYGFSVSSSGNFIVGPGPQGQTTDGSINAEEMKSLKKLIADIQSHLIQPSISETNPDCSPHLNAGDPSVLELNYRDAHHVTIKKSKTDICFNSINASEAKSLSDAVEGLLKKYYPTPFPDDCINASQSLEKLYKSMKTCEKNSDCTYIDDNFLPLDTSSIDEFIADDCSFIKPIVVANSFSAVTNQLHLLTSRELAVEVCGKEKKRASCLQPKVVKSKQIDPVCHRGVCTVSPLIKLK